MPIYRSILVSSTFYFNEFPLQVLLKLAHHLAASQNPFIRLLYLARHLEQRHNDNLMRDARPAISVQPNPL